MAQVDFTNAVIEALYTNSKVITLPNIGTSTYGNQLFDSSLNRLTTNETVTTPIENLYQKSQIYTGTFTASGTEFYLLDTDTRFKTWKVSNISFNSGDTYRFQLDEVITFVG